MLGGEHSELVRGRACVPAVGRGVGGGGGGPAQNVKSGATVGVASSNSEVPTRIDVLKPLLVTSLGKVKVAVSVPVALKKRITGVLTNCWPVVVILSSTYWMSASSP